jgi:DNA polymerase beta
MNISIKSMLYEMARHKHYTGAKGGEKAYNKALEAISTLKWEINKSTLGQLSKLKIPGIGPVITSKIEEFVKTGKVKELEQLRKLPVVKSYIELSKINGVGPMTIRKWNKLNVYTLRDLRNKVAKKEIILTNNQKIGLTYYKDLNTPIPHNEVREIGNFVLNTLIRIDPNIVFNITGSYRRGAERSGDIDILISNKLRYTPTILPRYNNVLQLDPLYIATISIGQVRLTYICKSLTSGLVRKIDILHVPYESYWLALNYFTGSYTHNIMLRSLAKSKGYHLTHLHLQKVVKGKTINIPIESEYDIYNILGLEYLAPNKRG